MISTSSFTKNVLVAVAVWFVAAPLDAASGVNELYQIDPATGMSTLLNTFVFDTNMWLPPVVADTNANELFAVSTDYRLYQIPPNSGPLSSAPISFNTSSNHYQTLAYLGGSLYAMGYNSTSSMNELYQVDPATGTSTLLTTFAFDSRDGVTLSFVGDASTNQLLVVSTSDTLYKFNPDGSSSTVSLQGFDDSHNFLESLACMGGTLYADGYNSTSRLGEIYQIDPATGASQLLSTFDFVTGSWPFVADTDTNELYAISSADSLYQFDPNSDSVSPLTLVPAAGSPAFGSTNYLESIVSLPGSDELYAISYNTNVPEPSTLALLGVGAVALIAYRQRRRFRQ